MLINIDQSQVAMSKLQELHLGRSLNKLYPHWTQPQFIHIPIVVDDSVNEIVRLVFSCRYSHEILNLMTEETIRNTYFASIVPYSDRTSDNLINHIAVELQPDPFGVANNTRQKWLTGEIMNFYGMYLKDLSVTLASAPSVYFIPSNARHIFIQHPQNYTDQVIELMYRVREYSEFMGDDYVHSITNAIEFSGDPLDRDIIMNFCNDRGVHWYLLILDQRENHKSVIMFDSLLGRGSSEHILGERCAYLIEFINNFRNTVRRTYPHTVRWSSRRLRVRDFQFINGVSQQQRNGFDCGVFSLLNAKSFIRSWNHNMWEQNSIPFGRLMAIWNLIAFGRRADLPL